MDGLNDVGLCPGFAVCRHLLGGSDVAAGIRLGSCQRSLVIPVCGGCGLGCQRVRFGRVAVAPLVCGWLVGRSQRCPDCLRGALRSRQVSVRQAARRIGTEAVAPIVRREQRHRRDRPRYFSPEPECRVPSRRSLIRSGCHPPESAESCSRAPGGARAASVAASAALRRDGQSLGPPTAGASRCSLSLPLI
jgi:hypothetical protein